MAAVCVPDAGARSAVRASSKGPVLRLVCVSVLRWNEAEVLVRLALPPSATLSQAPTAAALWRPGLRFVQRALHQLLWRPAAHAARIAFHTVPRGARVNSVKSSTYSTNVESRSIAAKPAPPSPAAAVRTLTVDAESAGQRLDNYLLRLLKGVPKTHIYRVIRSGEVRVNKGRAGADTRVAEGDQIRVPPMRVAAPTVSTAPAREFPVLMEDEHLLAIDKPAGVAVHGGSGVSFGVIEQLRRSRPQAKFLELVHRLDKETSGILLLAKKRSALNALQDQFRARDTAKIYAALVFGAWPAKLKVIDQALHKSLNAEGERHVRVVATEAEGAQRSITLVKVACAYAGVTLLDVTLKTGRTHQIRVHLAANGHPIVGDPKYGDFAANKAFAKARGFERMFLHARELAFDHPASGERITLQAALPPECEALCETLSAP
jgi:23S rRNA pseudouridine955/2504/2580 synthase